MDGLSAGQGELGLVLGLLFIYEPLEKRKMHTGRSSQKSPNELLGFWYLLAMLVVWAEENLQGGASGVLQAKS